jgi:hypothetical protein
MKRTTRLRVIAETFRALDFEINFSSVDAWFPVDGMQAALFVTAVHNEFGKSVRCDRSEVGGRMRVNMSLG